ncbi:Heat shock transcription factor, partial [Coemansia helicoidea]
MNELVPRRARNLHRNIAVTPFLNKLYNIVDDSASDDLIRWSAEGNSFVVVRHEDFAKEVLPHFFKHNNFSSFVRQLNMYGFHKVPHLQHGGLIADSPDAECWEFSNEHFQRGKPDLLHYIHRKKGSRDSAAAGLDATHDGALSSHASDGEGNGDSGPSDAGQLPAPASKPPPHSAGAVNAGMAASASSEAAAEQPPAKGADPAGAKARSSRTPTVNLARVLKEIQVIRDHQMTISSDIKRLQEENQSLWMQARTTEERYIKHQETIDKILRFLATVFSSDARHSEIRPPLRRLISHNAHTRRGNDSGGDEPSHSSGATPWVQSVFDEMDFPDSLSAGPPPDKRQRTGRGPRSPHIYEMPPGVSLPEIQRAAGVGSSASGFDDSSHPLRRSGSSAQVPSTALTRMQPWNMLHSQRSPSVPSLNGGGGGGDSSMLQAQPEYISQLAQKVDNMDVTLNNLQQLISLGVLSQLAMQPPPQHLLGAAMPAAGPGAGSFPSSIAPQDAVAGGTGSLAGAQLNISAADIDALLASGALDNLPPPLDDTALPATGHSGSSSQPQGLGAIAGMDLTPFVGAAHGAPSSMLTTNPAAGCHTEFAGGDGSGTADTACGVGMGEPQGVFKSDPAS